MNELEIQALINESELDRAFYFQSLFQNICSKGILNGRQIERIKLELIELLGKETERYTNGESSSVKVEKAQELLQSVTYCMGVYFKSINNMNEKIELLQTEKVISMFNKGMDCVSSLKDRASVLLQNLIKNSLKTDNIAYQDTVFEGIPKFFHDYNIEFEAQEIPADIDYPLLDTITDLLGVEYIYEYLRRLTIENNFLKHFSDTDVSKLLHQFDKESEQLLINIYEMVLTNAIGCELLKLNIKALVIPAADLTWLQNSLKNLGEDEIFKRITEALHHIGDELSLEPEILTYSDSAIGKLITRLKNNLNTDTLNRLFITWSEDNYIEEEFKDGLMMEDSELRLLIEEINRMQSVPEKVAKIGETVHNTYDFIELLEECFCGEEYEMVFQLLGIDERSVLKNRVLKEAGEAYSDYVPEKLWQKILFQM